MATRRHYIRIVDSQASILKVSAGGGIGRGKEWLWGPQHGKPTIWTHHPAFLEPVKRDTHGLPTYLSTLTHRELHPATLRVWVLV